MENIVLTLSSNKELGNKNFSLSLDYGFIVKPTPNHLGAYKATKMEFKQNF